MSLHARYNGVSLGVFAGDMCNTSGEAQAAEAWGCDLLHFDVMDGVFVPQLTGGPGLVKIPGNTMLKDVHLMVQRPVTQAEAFVAAGADAITVHVESDGCLEAIAAIRAASKKYNRDVLVGVSLMPGTQIDQARAAFQAGPDTVLVLAVDPRSSVPADVPKACIRLDKIRKILPKAVMAFDGGVTLETLPQIVETGADVVVSGSAIMRAADPGQSFAAMQNMMLAAGA